MVSRKRWVAGRLAALAAAAFAPGVGAQEGDMASKNILEARTEVASMAEQTVNSLKGSMTIEGVAGWAVFSGKPLTARLDAGVGLAESPEGEDYFLQIIGGDQCISPDYRRVLVFRDEDLFRVFRQGNLQGQELARLQQSRPRGDVLTFKVEPRLNAELEPADLSTCNFTYHEDLQRALVAEPSATDEIIEEDEVYEDDL